ncbi:MAG: hypothetical protein ABI605_19375 [Rhizobacter sp.]
MQQKHRCLLRHTVVALAIIASATAWGSDEKKSPIVIGSKAGNGGDADPIAGTDKDQDGIRDDIQAFIAGSKLSSPQQAASRQFAKVMQDAMRVDKTDLAAVKAISIRSSRAVRCIYARFDGPQSKPPAAVVAQLREISTNTQQRSLAYRSYAQALSGTSGALPTGNTCE